MLVCGGGITGGNPDGRGGGAAGSVPANISTTGAAGAGGGGAKSGVTGGTKGVVGEDPMMGKFFGGSSNIQLN